MLIQAMMDDTIERAALGNVARLGSLYDASTDKFCGISMLHTNKLPDDAVCFIPSRSCELSVIKSDSMKAKFEKLSVTADLKLSVLSGLFKLEGSGKYLDKKKSSYRAIECTRVHNIVTGVEHLELFNNKLVDCISLDALRHESATHVVIDIHYGANCFLTFHYENREECSRTDIEGRMMAAFNRIPKVTLEGGSKVNTLETNTSSRCQFAFRVFGDVLPATNHQSPNTCEEALAMVDQMVNETCEVTGDRGKPIKYVLFPLSAVSFRTYLANRKVQMAPVRVITRALTESAIEQFVGLFDDMRGCVQHVNDYVDDMEMYAYCLGEADVKEAIKCRRHVAECETEMRVKLARALPGLRSGNDDNTTKQVEELLKQYQKLQAAASEELTNCKNVYKRVLLKIGFVQLCEKYGVKYKSYTEEARRLWLDNDEVYVLYASTELRKEKPDVWERNEKAFISLAKDSQKKATATNDSNLMQEVRPSNFVFVDGDFDIDEVNTKGIRIEKYCKSECVSMDVAAPETKSESSDEIILEKRHASVITATRAIHMAEDAENNTRLLSCVFHLLFRKQEVR